jgi:predicted RNase H-like nuclease (RuvC/YqgF family)
MSNNQNGLIQETKELLESAQKEVIKEINNKQNWLNRIFKKEDLSSLKLAQSSISKALNQMKNFVKDDSSLINKLQNHLNEKNSSLKKLEEEFNKSQVETSTLKDKIRFLETEFEKLRQEKLNQANQEEPLKATNQAETKELIEKIKNLELNNEALVKKFSISQENLQENQKLTHELSGRIKRLKSEIVSSHQ